MPALRRKAPKNRDVATTPAMLPGLRKAIDRWRSHHTRIQGNFARRTDASSPDEFSSLQLVQHFED